MQDLAVLVAIILTIAFFAGPIAFIATRIPSKSRIWVISRRLIVFLFSLMGIIFSIQLLIAGIPLLPKLLAISGISFALLALIKEWKSFSGKQQGE